MSLDIGIWQTQVGSFAMPLAVFETLEKLFNLSLHTSSSVEQR